MSSLRSINPDSPKRIRVKILKFMIEKVSSTRSIRNYIMCDNYGVRIHATSSPIEDHEADDPLLAIGNWVQISKFKVVWNSAFIDKDSFVKTTSHSYMIKFTHWTVVDACTPGSSSLLYKFADFNKIRDKTLDLFTAVDFIGAAVNITRLEKVDYWKYSGVVDEIRFDLQDQRMTSLYLTSGMTIKCIVVKENARQFNKVWTESNGAPIIYLFKWWKITQYGRELFAEPGGDYGEIIINADIPEIVRFRSMILAPDSFSSSNEQDN